MNASASPPPPLWLACNVCWSGPATHVGSCQHLYCARHAPAPSSEQQSRQHAGGQGIHPGFCLVDGCPFARNAAQPPGEPLQVRALGDLGRQTASFLEPVPPEEIARAREHVRQLEARIDFQDRKKDFTIGALLRERADRQHELERERRYTEDLRARLEGLTRGSGGGSGGGGMAAAAAPGMQLQEPSFFATHAHAHAPQTAALRLPDDPNAGDASGGFSNNINSNNSDNDDRTPATRLGLPFPTPGSRGALRGEVYSSSDQRHPDSQGTTTTTRIANNNKSTNGPPKSRAHLPMREEEFSTPRPGAGLRLPLTRSAGRKNRVFGQEKAHTMDPPQTAQQQPFTAKKRPLAAFQGSQRLGLLATQSAGRPAKRFQPDVNVSMGSSSSSSSSSSLLRRPETPLFSRRRPADPERTATPAAVVDRFARLRS
jgi:hypothetical protein